MNSKHSVLLGMFLAAACAGCATSMPVENMTHQPVPKLLDGSSRSLQQVKTAIVNGCQAKRWTPVEVGDNEVKCSILVRGQHFAEVSIPFSRDEYSIVYSDSRVLDYDEEKQHIHRNYNKWVILLSQTIQQQFDSV